MIVSFHCFHIINGFGPKKLFFLVPCVTEPFLTTVLRDASKLPIIIECCLKQICKDTFEGHQIVVFTLPYREWGLRTHLKDLNHWPFVWPTRYRPWDLPQALNPHALLGAPFHLYTHVWFVLFSSFVHSQ